MRSKIIVAIVCILFAININAQEETNLIQVGERCPRESPISQLNTKSRLYFTIPDDYLNLKLWYADSNGLFQTPVALRVEDLLSISPNGDYIIVIRTDDDYVLRNLFYDYFGSNINEILLVDSESYEVTSVEIPEWVNEYRYVKRIQWISDTSFALVSTTENITSMEVDILDGSITSHDWDLPRIELTYPDGETRISPNGKYMFYTTDVSSEERSWNVANHEGEVLLTMPQYEQPYKAVTWLHDSSGLITTYDDGSIVVYSLEANNAYYQYEQNGIVSEGGIPSSEGEFIAFVGRYFDSTNSGNYRSLVIYQSSTPHLLVYCNAILQVDLGSWSDNSLFAFIARDTNYTQIFILDVNANKIVGILPSLETSDSINSIYVRVVGWN